jgi:N-acetyl-gamma-glutamyl-phosphate reductase
VYKLSGLRILFSAMLMVLKQYSLFETNQANDSIREIYRYETTAKGRRLVIKKVFIDGRSGTTGLRIYERLESRTDIELITLSDEDRRDIGKRQWALNHSDISFLCLPDDAARESVSLIDNPNVMVIDTSTAHRTQPDWAYGFPELSDHHRNKIIKSKRIASPGCHAGGFIALVYPLIEAGILKKSAELTCMSLTGYSGGGKGMIEDYEVTQANPFLNAPRAYALGQVHKHLPEMRILSGMDKDPIFSPVVADFYSGMLVMVSIFPSMLTAGYQLDDIRNVYKNKYTGPVVQYMPTMDVNGFISAGILSGKDSMHISAYGNDDRIMLTALYDNLGKGASGAALQCMNIAMGVDETLGLDL